MSGRPCGSGRRDYVGPSPPRSATRPGPTCGQRVPHSCPARAVSIAFLATAVCRLRALCQRTYGSRDTAPAHLAFEVLFVPCRCRMASPPIRQITYLASPRPR